MSAFERMAQLPRPALHAAGMMAGAAAGASYAALALVSSPAVAACAILAAGAVGFLLLSPWAAFLLTALVVPLERTGRLTDDSAVATVSLMKLVGVLALAAFALNVLLARKRLVVPRPVLLYGAYVGFGAFTLLYTSDATGSIRAMSLVIGNLLFFFMAANLIRDTRFARLSLGCWLAANGAVALATTIQFHSPDAVIEDVDYYKDAGELSTEHRFSMVIYDQLLADGDRSKRAIGTTSHPAVYALNLLLALPFYVYFIRVPGRWQVRAAALAGALLTLYNILLANTRAAVVVLAITLAAMMLTGLLRVTVRNAVVAALLAAALLALNPKDIWNRALNLRTYSSRVGVVEERRYMWSAALSVIGETWWRGTGIGNQQEVPARVRQKVAASSAHNDVLALLVETGVPGLAIMLAFLVSLHAACRNLEKRFASIADPEGYWMAVAARVLIWIVAAYGIQVESLSLPIKGFWLAFGIVAGLTCSSAAMLVQARPRGVV